MYNNSLVSNHNIGRGSEDIRQRYYFICFDIMNLSISIQQNVFVFISKTKTN